MTRRYQGTLLGQRYLGDGSTMKAHDLDNEKPECRIDDVVAAGDGVPFVTIASAHSASYADCSWCFAPVGP